VYPHDTFTSDSTMKNTSTPCGGLLLVLSLSPSAFGQARPLPSSQLLDDAQPGFLEQVWYGSNLGSIDLLDMFTAPEQWDQARSEIDVFLLSGSQVGSGGWSCTVLPNATCADNHLDNLVQVQAFPKLRTWGIDLAIESFFAGPLLSVDPVVCSSSAHVSSLTLNGSVNVIQNVQANGGVVHTLRIDEPIRQWYPTHYYLQTGQTDPRPCLVNSLDAVADHVVPYIQQMQTWFPTISIGQVELYPEVSVESLKEWILILEARGVSLPYLHLDVHYPRVEQYNGWGLNIDVGADMRELRSFAADRGMAFGVIYTDVSWDSQLWDPSEYDDQAYYESTVEWIDLVEAANVRPHHLIYQSWVQPYYTTGAGMRQIPTNLPEDSRSVFSQTRLINETH